MPKLANGTALRWLRDAVEMDTQECIEWPFSLQDGYAVFGRAQAGLPRRAARAAYILVHGPIPSSQWVLHRCDNPPCINPAHLFVGTPADNAQDRSAKGRSRHAEYQKVKTHCPQGHAYDDDNTSRDKYGNRSCRTCHRERERVRRADKRARAYNDLVDKVNAVLAIDPADHATKSRDFGRGFAEALRQVRVALGAADV